MKKSGKAAVLYENEHRLHHVFLKQDNRVEFYFPHTKDSYLSGVGGKQVFKYNERNNQLNFKNNKSLHQIYETENTVGIKLQIGVNTYEMKGIKSTAVGSLKKLKAKLTNVINEPRKI